MNWQLILVCSLITLATFLSWEVVAWFSHKYIMHGFLWIWHKSHHTVHNQKLEKNDLFAIVFSIPSIFLFYFFSQVAYNPYMLSVGLGIFCYGIFYVIFHDIIVHQRIGWRPSKRSRYLQRMINAHYIHHGKHSKAGCEAFGFLYAPKKICAQKFRAQKKENGNPVNALSKYLYLILNLASFVIPFIFSFHPKVRFFQKWKFVIPGIVITACIFILWDELFTRMGIWGFNSRYLSGIYIMSLPIEEVLFFICIPYACFFTYHAMNLLFVTNTAYRYGQVISVSIVACSLMIGVYYISRLYTSITFLGLGFFLTLLLTKIRPYYMDRFYRSFLFLLIPFFIVNGILTGSLIDEPVIWYNNQENLGIRLGTIPIEDIFYAMLMLMMSVTIAEELEARSAWKKIARGERA
jgi:beta-carotene 3-hydroxylase